MEKTQSVKVNPKEIPAADYDLACSILASSVRRLFSKPSIKEEYEEWLKSEEREKERAKENEA